MELITLKCPNCGANIEIENGIDTFFCKYCGHRIILDGQSDAAINAKVRIKEVESNERIRKEELIFKRESEAEKKKSDFRQILFGFGILFLILAITRFSIYRGNKGAEAQEKELQTIVDEIMIDIENGDFDEARVKANMLYWDSSWTNRPKKKWDQTRKEIIKQIDKAEKAAKKAKNNVKTDVKITNKSGNIPVGWGPGSKLYGLTSA